VRPYARSSYDASRRIFLPVVLFAFGLGCEEEPPLARLAVSGAFEPAQLDYGDVTVGTTNAKQVELKSVGSATFVIGSIETPPSFALRGEKDELEGIEIAAGSSIFLNAIFIAQEEGDRSGEIKVIPTKDGDSAVLTVHANGKVRREPMLSLQPDALEFGTVEIGGEARLDISIVNNGNAPGVITGATLQSTSAPVDGMSQYGVVTPMPITVPEGQSQRVTIIYRSIFEGPRPDQIVFTASDHGPLTLRLGATGQAARGGLICQPSSVDFGRVERGMTSQEMVRCTARGGQVRIVGASFPPNAENFALASPVGTADLMDGQGVDVAIEFRPEGLPGIYRETLSVQFNGAGGISTVTIPVSGEIIPPPPTATAISVVLRWDTNLTDIDMHFLRPGGSTFAANGSDCFYLQMNPDWGRVGDRTDDPFLDRDDTDGFGPENMNLSETAAGSYELYVHSYADQRRRVTTATVEIYLAGNLVATIRQGLSCKDMWHAGTITWNGMNGTFNPTTDVRQISQGFCF
jgi:hypothetical protein